MDSINGHSDENQPKIEKIDPINEITISDLPFNEQERIRTYMAMTGMEEPPKLFEIKMYISDYYVKFISINDLAIWFRDLIVSGDYEQADILRNEIKNRNYSIEIGDKLLTLRKID